jgi:SHS2 domain-containing protein
MYELFEHTADLGLRVRAPDLDSLFREAAEGFFAILAEGAAPSVAEERSFRFELDAARHDDLLFDWLHELLYTFDTTGCVLRGFEVRVQGARLEATARGAPLEQEKRGLLREIKAITYHGLKVEPEGGGWLAEVIVDI